MEKVDILTKITNKSELTKKEYNIKGIKTKSKVAYKEDDVSVIINFKKDMIILNRKNKDMEMSLWLKEGKSKGYYKVLERLFDIEIDVNKIVVDEYYIYVEYDIYFENYKNGEFIFEVEIKK